MKYFKLYLVIALAIIPLAPIKAGHPNCDMKEGAPCGMKSCSSFDKRGKQTGNHCSKYCARGCCGCGKTCNRPEPPAHNPDEEGF